MKRFSQQITEVGGLDELRLEVDVDVAVFLKFDSDGVLGSYLSTSVPSRLPPHFNISIYR